MLSTSTGKRRINLGPLWLYMVPFAGWLLMLSLGSIGVPAGYLACCGILTALALTLPPSLAGFLKTRNGKR